MPYFFCEDTIILNKSFTIRGAELRHMRLARKIRVHEIVEVQDPNYKRYQCKVEQVQNSYVCLCPLQMVNKLAAHQDPWQTADISLYCTPLKEKALDFILQKATEMDVKDIHLFRSRFSGVLPMGKPLEKKKERWIKITKESCKQCGRFQEPAIFLHQEPKLAFEDATQRCEQSFLLDPSTEALNIANLSLPIVKKIALFVGPEGGFSDQERSLFMGTKIRLNTPVLRAETACIAGVAMLKLAAEWQKTVAGG